MKKTKKILFVINTLGQAGAETALMSLFRTLAREKGEDAYDIFLYVLTGQGEMRDALPAHVTLLNRRYRDLPVLSVEGQKVLKKTVMAALWKRGNWIRLFPYLVKNAFAMLRAGKIMPDKLLWRVLSDAGLPNEEEYDLAVAYLEGGSTYYLADHIKAKKKAAFVHVDYRKAGYTRSLDNGCYSKIDRIFAVSDEVKDAFLDVYPECADKTDVFHNILDTERILRMSGEGDGFADHFEGKRILTIGRLTAQKAFEVSVEAMRLVKERGYAVRWYVLGEGDQRRFLEGKIAQAGLQEDFLLCGATPNPYPFLKQADLYVHASRFEGKSIAIQEAQVLGKPILTSDCSGNREQVIHGEDGLLCDFRAEAICDGICAMLDDEDLCRKLGAAAAGKNKGAKAELDKLLELLEETHS